MEKWSSVQGKFGVESIQISWYRDKKLKRKIYCFLFELSPNFYFEWRPTKQELKVMIQVMKEVLRRINIQDKKLSG